MAWYEIFSRTAYPSVLRPFPARGRTHLRLFDVDPDSFPGRTLCRLDCRRIGMRIVDSASRVGGPSCRECVASRARRRPRGPAPEGRWRRWDLNVSRRDEVRHLAEHFGGRSRPHSLRPWCRVPRLSRRDDGLDAVPRDPRSTASRTYRGQRSMKASMPFGAACGAGRRGPPRSRRPDITLAQPFVVGFRGQADHLGATQAEQLDCDGSNAAGGA